MDYKKSKHLTISPLIAFRVHPHHKKFFFFCAIFQTESNENEFCFKNTKEEHSQVTKAQKYELRNDRRTHT